MEIIKGHSATAQSSESHYEISMSHISCADSLSYLFESLLQKTTLSTSPRSSITPRQVSYKNQPSLRHTRSITRAEHLNNYYCSCCSKRLLGAQPAAPQVTVRAHSLNRSWAGGSQERAKPPGHARSRYGNVTQLLHCT